MDEFDKIREFSEDITKRKEPTFEKEGEDQQNEFEQDDDASLYDFKPEFSERFGVSPLDELEEKNFSSMKLHMIALAIFIGVLTIALIGFFMFGESSQSDEIVTITATTEPVKVRPEQPGGMNIPDQDKLVYNRIRSNNVNTKVESLFPEPEQPVMPTILAIENNAPTSDFVAMEEVKSFDPLTEAPAAQPGSVSEPVVVPQPAPKIEEVPLKPVTETPKVAQKTTPKTTSGDTWTAQLMSSSNKQTVEKAWPQILAKNKALLSNMSHQITKADIPGKGTFYRLRVGSFKTRDMANALCKKLKAKKQDCIPAK